MQSPRPLPKFQVNIKIQLHAVRVSDYLSVSYDYDYSILERFSNVAHAISAKPLSSFFECEVLVVVSDRCDFKFSIKAEKSFNFLSNHLFHKS